MTPETGGRGCAKCQHHVPDLSAANDEELYAILSDGDAPKCARFRPDQLDRLVLPRWSDPVVALQVLVLSASTQAVAEESSSASPSLPNTVGNAIQEFDLPVNFVLGDVKLIPAGSGTICPTFGPGAEYVFGGLGLQFVPPTIQSPLVMVVPRGGSETVLISRERKSPPEPDDRERRPAQPVALTERRRFNIRAFAGLFRSWFGRPG